MPGRQPSLLVSPKPLAAVSIRWHKKANGKGIMDLLMLGAPVGSEVSDSEWR